MTSGGTELNDKLQYSTVTSGPRINNNASSHHVFINRLTAFFVNGASQTGFIPDVVRLLEKYNLSCVLDAYLRDSAFPSKFTWKRMVKYEIHSRELYQWHTRTSQPEFARFQCIVPTFGVHDFWTLSKTCPKFTNACKSVIQMIGSILDCDVQLCHKCNCFITMSLIIVLVNVHVYTMKELRCGIDSMHSILKFICI